MVRARRSGSLPAVKATTSRMGRVGQACWAAAGPASSPASVIAPKARRPSACASDTSIPSPRPQLRRDPYVGNTELLPDGGDDAAAPELDLPQHGLLVEVAELGLQRDMLRAQDR